MSNDLAVQNGTGVFPRRLDPYEAGLSAEAPRVDALAVISCGYRAQGEGNKPGLPRASRAKDERQIHLHDPLGRAPGLAAALEDGNHRQLLIAFPLDDPRAFIIQRFTRYSASRLEAYGDETAVTWIEPGDPPKHRRFDAGTPEYERLVKTCKADTRIYFCLAEWGADGPEVVFPDGLGTYAIRTTSRHSVRSILGTIAYTARFTHGKIAGLPFLLTVDHREVAGPDGSKRTVPVWTITTKPPEGARLSSRTFRQLATSALKEGSQLMLAAPDERTWEQMEADGPLQVEEPSDTEMEILDQGGLCDYDFYVKAWHALARGTAWEPDEARAAFIGAFTEDRTSSLSDYLRVASEARAAALIAALGAAIERSRQSSLAAMYDKAIASNYDDDFSGPPAAPGGGARDSVDTAPAAEALASPADQSEPLAEVNTSAQHVDDASQSTAAGSDGFHCSECNAVILDQAGEPINASQADIIRDRYGKLVCRDHRPKKGAKAATQQESMV